MIRLSHQPRGVGWTPSAYERAERGKGIHGAVSEGEQQPGPLASPPRAGPCDQCSENDSLSLLPQGSETGSGRYPESRPARAYLSS